MSRKRHPARGSTSVKRRRRGAGLGLGPWLLLIGVVLGVLGAGYVWELDQEIRAQFEGKRWALPTRVYARPLELYAGQRISAEQFAQELEDLRYRSASPATEPGTFDRKGNTFDIATRPFTFWDGKEPTHRLRLQFSGDHMSDVTTLDGFRPVGLARLDPMTIAGIYPAHNEDRILLKRDQLPDLLVKTLIGVEDRKFYHHIGIDPLGILRAILANLRAGRTVQGGSTLTQQLVKNYFLTNERTLARKINEMIMAILLELHYSKDQILEAYANEVYLGQDGQRAIHGFGLASRFYFDRPLDQLEPRHIALLVGLVRGPSYYDPRRHPERARERRKLVLDVMADRGLVSRADADRISREPLDVSARPLSGVTRYPAFLDLVRQQLHHDYREEDLRSEGLQVFTTLDPRIQSAVEKAIQTELPQLERRERLKPGSLQASAVFTDTQGGEVLALVGGRDSELAGFNRALDARRPIGSLVKPAVYLTALERPSRYTLATSLEDNPITYTSDHGQPWSPKNYDRRYRGRVLLEDALANSYNVPTVRLGLDLGVPEVAKTLHRLGLEGDIGAYPSLLLGSIDLTPFEVATIYQTIASGGYRTPLRAIREVTAADGTALSRYPLTVTQAIQPGPAYLLTRAMQAVVTGGTARSLAQNVPPAWHVAGKTGTTDDLRDSWFAGFTGDVLGVVWVGEDDNSPTGLSGATGALRVWAESVDGLNLVPLDPVAPSGVERVLVDPETGLRADESCTGARTMPFLAGSAPVQSAPCVTPWRSTNRPAAGTTMDMF
jgi:penicillin-binding protein 1B